MKRTTTVTALLCALTITSAAQATPANSQQSWTATLWSMLQQQLPQNRLDTRLNGKRDKEIHQRPEGDVCESCVDGKQ